MDTRPSVIDEATALLDDVDQVLVRLSEGTYRVCELCGADVGDARETGRAGRRRCDAH
jgi:RNA polymerase-binding transcription factor DksA